MTMQKENDFIKGFRFYMNNNVDNLYAALRWYNESWDRVVLLKIKNNKIVSITTGEKYGDERKEVNDFVFFEIPDISLGKTWKEIDFSVHFADFRQKDLIEKMQEALMEKQK